MTMSDTTEQVLVSLAESGLEFTYESFSQKGQYGYPSAFSSEWVEWVAHVNSILRQHFAGDVGVLNLLERANAVVLLGNGEDKFALARDLYVGVLRAAVQILKRRPHRDSHELPAPPKDSRRVFVVHGRNDALRRSLFAFLRAIGLEPIEWSQAVLLTGRPSPYIGDILDAAFSEAQAVVVLFTGDDEARLRNELRCEADPPHEAELTPQARPNVLFEAGIAMGRDSNRTILVEHGTLRPFSDIAGRLTLRLDDSSVRRQELADRLRQAGCAVDLSGTDWHKEGEF